MGEKGVPDGTDELQMRAFTRALLEDVRALERMLDGGLIESGVRRIGAEQEIFLVDSGCEPAPVATDVLKELADPAYATELARFNLEANLPPGEFGGQCLRRMEEQLDGFLDKARAAAQKCDADVLLTGILPTLQLSDLTLQNMTPVPRYAALNRALVNLRGGSFHVRIKGIDEFFAEHDNVMLESANTSFQIHFQVGGEEFAQLYNLAQAVTAPSLAAAVNSPLLCERRLWKETRVALFQHSVDDRSQAHLTRGQRPRVRFGDGWIENSVLEIFREDIARFRIILATDVEGSSLQTLDQGGTPELRALRLHNGTVYRWNRPCYGVRDGKAHLRIENRTLPAGPTVVDQVANAAFFFGLLAALSDEYGDITKVMSFDAVAANFLAAARHGLHAQLAWRGRQSTASELILGHLLPLARQGLDAHDIDSSDSDRYLGVLEERVKSGRTGAQWMLDSLAGMSGQGTGHERCRALTAATLRRQKEGHPGHEWKLATIDDVADWRDSYRMVGQFMTKDLFTVQPDDLVDLAASVMAWEHIRHVPVEDREGRLVGLISHRMLLRHFARRGEGPADPVPVSDIMKTETVTVPPETPTLEAIDIMRKSKIGCLPVVSNGQLVGIVTERDLINVASKLLEDNLRGFRES